MNKKVAENLIDLTVVSHPPWTLTLTNVSAICIIRLIVYINASGLTAVVFSVACRHPCLVVVCKDCLVSVNSVELVWSGCRKSLRIIVLSIIFYQSARLVITTNRWDRLFWLPDWSLMSSTYIWTFYDSASVSEGRDFFLRSWGDSILSASLSMYRLKDVGDNQNSWLASLATRLLSSVLSPCVSISSSGKASLNGSFMLSGCVFLTIVYMYLSGPSHQRTQV